MNDNNEKLERLSKMMDEMQDDYVEKAKQGDGSALARAGEMALLKAELKTSQSCQHEWVGDGCGRLYCSKCGADGGSPWDC